jgi:hypothetical protein
VKSAQQILPQPVEKSVKQPFTPMPSGYAELLEDLKGRIRQARISAGLAVNQELLLLYYGIGLELDRRDRLEAWGSGIINRLSQDLRQVFPEMEGLSPRNLRRMRAFYRAYPLKDAAARIWPQTVAKLDLIKWPPAVAKLPWTHNVILLEKCKDGKIRNWYAQAAVHHGWSYSVPRQKPRDCGICPQGHSKADWHFRILFNQGPASGTEDQFANHQTVRNRTKEHAD